MTATINHRSLRPCKHASMYAATCPKCKAEKPRDVLGIWMAICKRGAAK